MRTTRVSARDVAAFNDVAALHVLAAVRGCDDDDATVVEFVGQTSASDTGSRSRSSLARGPRGGVTVAGALVGGVGPAREEPSSSARNGDRNSRRRRGTWRAGAPQALRRRSRHGGCASLSFREAAGASLGGARRPEVPRRDRRRAFPPMLVERASRAPTRSPGHARRPRSVSVAAVPGRITRAAPATECAAARRCALATGVRATCSTCRGRRTAQRLARGSGRPHGGSGHHCYATC